MSHFTSDVSDTRYLFSRTMESLVRSEGISPNHLSIDSQCSRSRYKPGGVLPFLTKYVHPIK